jgi:acetyl-CoA C-acetyltransferase
MEADRVPFRHRRRSPYPDGRLLGSLKDFSGADLGGIAIKGVLDRAGVAPEQVQYVIIAARSHQLAAAAWKNGVFDEEVVPISVPQRRGDPIEIRFDEGIRSDTTVQTLARLEPAFRVGGTITAGSASQISDGAAVVVVMSMTRAEKLGQGDALIIRVPAGG